MAMIFTVNRGREIVVAGSEPGFDAIQCAIDKAEMGDRIIVQRGDYLTGGLLIEKDGISLEFEPEARLTARSIREEGYFKYKNCLATVRNCRGVSLIGEGAVLGMRKEEYPLAAGVAFESGSVDRGKNTLKIEDHGLVENYRYACMDTATKKPMAGLDGRGHCYVKIIDEDEIRLSFDEDGNKPVRLMDGNYRLRPYVPGHRHVLKLEGAGAVLVRGLTLRDSGGDGIYVGRGCATEKVAGMPRRYCDDVTVERVNCFNNYRCAVSAVSVKGLMVDGCRLNDTRGGSPAAGFFAEPNRPDELLQGIRVKNTVIRDNQYRGIHLNFDQLRGGNCADVDMEFENIYIADSMMYHAIEVKKAYSDGPGGRVLFKDVLTNGDRAGLNVALKSKDAFGLEFENCIVDKVSPAAEAPITFYLGNETKVGGVEFRNCQVIDHTERPAVAAYSAPGRSWHKVHGDIWVWNPARPVNYIEWGDNELCEADLEVGWGRMEGYLKLVERITKLINPKK